MSLPDDAVYLQFHPLVYLLKLHIEMNLAELLAKIVRASNELNDCGGVCGGIEGGGSGSSGQSSGGQLSKAVAIDFDIYTSHTNTTTGHGSVHNPAATNPNHGEGSTNLPSNPPAGVRRNNSNNNHYFDLEMGLHIPPDTKDDTDSHHHSGLWRKAVAEEDRSLNDEARRLGVGADPIAPGTGPTGLRGGGGSRTPSIERHTSGSELMKLSSDGS